MTKDLIVIVSALVVLCIPFILWGVAIYAAFHFIIKFW